jgi:small subunit ribosomal protein S8e
MGIGRDSRHKHHLTGARRNSSTKKRKFELGRPAAMTRLGTKRIRLIRTRGGNTKQRALHLDHGTFSWPTESTLQRDVTGHLVGRMTARHARVVRVAWWIE